MNIARFAALTGLSAHTLRYYEKRGLLNHVSRNQSGQRVYSQSDVEWVTFINRLKATGMPLQQIHEYAALREIGSRTNEQRQDLLERHRDALKSRIENELTHLRALDAKIAFYQSQKP